MQKELRNILTINTPNPFNLPAPLNSAMGMISNAQAGNVSFPGTLANPNPTPTCGAQNSADDDGGTDDIPKESNHGTETLIYNHVAYHLFSVLMLGPGVFLGYPNRDKYRVWVADLTQNELEAAERSCVDYIDLGKKLLQLLFNKELSEPDNYCRTKSDGKQLLDQMKLKGMRCNVIAVLTVMFFKWWPLDEEVTSPLPPPPFQTHNTHVCSTYSLSLSLSLSQFTFTENFALRRV